VTDPMTDKGVAAKPVMPRPFYVGSPLSTTVSFALLPGEADRALLPGERRLGRFILPPFQRPPVWTREQQVKLIESIWLRLPIGSFFYNEAPLGHETDQWLIDGQQRITALLSYIAGDFDVFGHRWQNLPRVDQRSFEMSHFPCVQLGMTDRDKLEDIYNRLAYGGTAHEPR
jgi:uncharacterized protein with ParB-like and HNH nuclease domain